MVEKEKSNIIYESYEIKDETTGEWIQQKWRFETTKTGETVAVVDRNFGEKLKDALVSGSAAGIMAAVPVSLLGATEYATSIGVITALGVGLYSFFHKERVKEGRAEIVTG
ncbi:MAG: hypothetical protein QW112_02510 [Candidatus Micrarchaeia archaeon]